MPIWPATGISSGPKMISAAAPSRTEPMTIRMRIDSSRNGEAPHLRQRDHRLRQSMGNCCNVSTKASDCAAATMNSTSPERVAALTKLRRGGARSKLAERRAAHDERVERGESGNLGCGRNSEPEPGKNDDDEPEGDDRADAKAALAAPSTERLPGEPRIAAEAG